MKSWTHNGCPPVLRHLLANTCAPHSRLNRVETYDGRIVATLSGGCVRRRSHPAAARSASASAATSPGVL